MLLHNDKELFREAVISTAEDLGAVVPIVEKKRIILQSQHTFKIIQSAMTMPLKQ